ncbi:hypothetical protein [Arsenicibacter rosenii]|uniref:ADP,ATP carrier protein n=1 Tax=Arsenicibacter rosenii TaxID=1750698 RepID=A0A1S2VRY7_9BACT|nr:hypothetical protein [Arsenicibacter rosenii]OIN60648.1 hypothetical protein BLX24_00590 [Arsenicibacter rosenii]
MITRKYIQGILSIKPEEAGSVRLLVGYSFVISLGLYMYYTAATTLFLSNFKNKDLPVAYIAGGVFVFLIGKGNLFIQSKVLYATLSRWLLIGLTIVSGILLYLYFLTHYTWIVFLLFLLIRANLFVFSFTFWITASKIFNLEQAKRLFGLLGTGEVIASIVANFLVSFLVSNKLVSVDGFLIIAVGCIAASIFFYSLIQREYKSTLSFRKAPPISTETTRKPFFFYKKDQYELFVYLLASLPIICLYLIEYIFSVDTKAQYRDKEQLAAFIGQFLFTCSLIELVIKSFLYRFVTDTFGLSSSLILLPAALLFISVAILLLYTIDVNIFFLVLMSRFFITSIRRSFSDTSFQLLYQPLPASESIHLQNLVEIYVKPLGYIIAGGSLIFLTSSGFTNSTDVYSLLLIYLVIWAAIAYLMREEYKTKLIDFLANRTPLLLSTPATLPVANMVRPVKPSGTQADLRTLEKLADAADENDRLKAINILQYSRLLKTDKLIIKLLNDKSITVRSAAIWAGSASSNPEVWEHISQNLFIDTFYQITYKALCRLDEPVLPLLNRYFYDKNLGLNDLKKLIDVITAIGGPQAVHSLRKHIDGQNPAIRFYIFRALLQLGYEVNIREKSLLSTDIDHTANRYLWSLAVDVNLKKEQAYGIDLLIKSLRYEQESAIDTLLVLLSLYHNNDKFLYLKDLIKNKNKQSRGYLNEILNTLIAQELKLKLLPVFEDISNEEILIKTNKYFPQRDQTLTDCLFDLINRSEQDIHIITKALAIKLLNHFDSDKSLLLYATYARSKHKLIAQLCLYSLYTFYNEHFNLYFTYFIEHNETFYINICHEILADTQTNKLEICKIESLFRTELLPFKDLDDIHRISADLHPGTLKAGGHLNFSDIISTVSGFSGIILTSGKLVITPPNDDLFFMDAPNYYFYSNGLKEMKAIEDCALYYISRSDRQSPATIYDSVSETEDAV